MPAVIHLVRHGEVWNPQGVVYAALEGFGLSRLGRAQAATAADYLAGRELAAIVTSPLLRARQTAQVIAARHAVTPQPDRRLEEWRSADRWAGHRWDDLRRVFPGELEAYLEAPDTVNGVETMAEVSHRVAAAIHDAIPEEGEAVFITHQDPLQAGRFRLMGRPLSELNLDKPGHAEVITLRRGGTWEEVARWAPATQHPFPPDARAGGASS